MGMNSRQEQYDEAMYEYSSGNYAGAAERLREILRADPEYFDAQLSLGMALYRQGDFAGAIAEGHKAEEMNPREQLVHTNLSLFYMKAGDKVKAEHHGLKARIASWKADKSKPGEAPPASELQMAQPKTATPPPAKFPEMPWKKSPPAGSH